VHDPVLVRGFESVGDLAGDRQRFVRRHRASSNSLGKRRPVNEFQHERAYTVAGFSRALLDPVYRADVRMVQRREHLRFSFEARKTVRIGGKQSRQYLERDGTIQVGVSRAIDLAHTTCTNRRFDFVGAEARASREGRTVSSCVTLRDQFKRRRVKKATSISCILQ
jgi:hypothetical protein